MLQGQKHGPLLSLSAYARKCQPRSRTATTCSQCLARAKLQPPVPSHPLQGCGQEFSTCWSALPATAKCSRS
eukprot:7479814-Karenia_brevis.AAC.1